MMSRLFVPLFILLFLVTAFNAIDLFMGQAHCISDVAVPMDSLTQYQGDKNSAGYAALVEKVKQEVVLVTEGRAHAASGHAFAFGGLAVVQLVLALCLARSGRGPKAVARTQSAAPPAPCWKRPSCQDKDSA